MTEALNFIYYIYDKFVDLVFNRLEFFNNVTVGWVAVGCFIFGILIKSLLALPRSAPTYTSDSTMQHNILRRNWNNVQTADGRRWQFRTGRKGY